MATASFSLFDNASRGLANTVANAVQRGLSTGLSAATQSSAAQVGTSVASTLSNAVQRSVSSFAIGAAEAVSQGREVVGAAVENASRKASEILSNAVSRIGQWQSFLTQNVLGGLSRVLGDFVSRFGNALGGLPGTVARFIGGLFGAGSGALGRAGGIGGLFSHLLSFPLRALRSGNPVGALLNRYDARTGRYHNILTNQFSSFATGRGEFTGALGNLWARVREGIAHLAQGIVGVFRGVTNAVRTTLGLAWTVVTAAVRGAAQAIAQAVISVPQLLAPLLLAGMAAGGAVIRAVMPLATALRTVIGQAIGWVGNAVSSLATQAAALASRAWGFIAPLMGRFFGFLGNLFTQGFSWLKGAAGTVANFAGNLASRVAGFAGTLIQGIIRFARTFISNLLTFLQGSFQIGVAIVAMGLFAKAVYEAAKSAMEFAKSAQYLSATSGRSFGASAALLMRGRVLGIGEQSLQSAYGENPFLTRLKSSFWGVNATDIAGVANKFQSLMRGGFMGQMLAQAMAKSLNMNSPDWMQALMQRPSAIRANQAYQTNLNAKMGFTPSSLQRYAEEIPMLLGRIGAAWDAIKMKLATVALPVIERLGNALANWVAGNADQIAGWIETIAEWMFVQAPVMLANGLVMVTNVIQNAVSGLVGVLGSIADWLLIAAQAVINFGTFLAEGLPKWLGAAAQWVADTMRNLARLIAQYAPVVAAGVAKGLAGIGHTVAEWLRGFGEALYQMTFQSNPLRQLVEGLAGAFDGIINAVRDFGRAMVITEQLFYLSSPLANAWQAKTSGALVTPVSMWKTVGQYNDDFPESNIKGSIQKFFNSPALSNAAADITNFADNLEKRMNTLGVSAGGHIMDAARWTQKRLHQGADWLAPQGRPDLNKGFLAGSAAGSYISYGANQLGGLLGNVSGMIGDAKDFVAGNIQPGANALADAAKTFQTMVGSESDRKAQWDELMSEERKQTAVAEAGLRAQWDQLMAMNAFIRAAGRVGSYIAEDAALNMTRVTG
jgi:hypothetical protein